MRTIRRIGYVKDNVRSRWNALRHVRNARQRRCAPREYGDMRAFVKKLKECGYEKVELVDTTDGLFLTKKESRAYMLAHSKLLVGKK